MPRETPMFWMAFQTLDIQSVFESIKPKDTQMRLDRVNKANRFRRTENVLKKVRIVKNLEIDPNFDMLVNYKSKCTPNWRERSWLPTDRRWASHLQQFVAHNSLLGSFRSLNAFVNFSLPEFFAFRHCNKDFVGCLANGCFLDHLSSFLRSQSFENKRWNDQYDSSAKCANTLSGLDVHWWVLLDDYRSWIVLGWSARTLFNDHPSARHIRWAQSFGRVVPLAH